MITLLLILIIAFCILLAFAAWIAKILREDTDYYNDELLKNDDLKKIIDQIKTNRD